MDEQEPVPPSVPPTELATAEEHELPSLAVRPTDLTTVLPADIDYQDVQSLGSESMGSEGPEDGEDRAEWDAAIEEARSAWTAEEAEAIVADLKEIGMAKFIHKYIGDEAVPLRKLLFALGVVVAPDFDQGEAEAILRVLKAAITRVLRQRDKLETVNTPEDVIQLIRRSRKILVLTGAGVSTSAGLPDFRSADGIYARIESSDGFQLSDPQEMFDIDIFREHPPIFFSFAKELYPSNYVPTPSHRFVKLLEDQGKLLRNYTQNIDTLEHLAGVRKVLHCHGSFATASCIKCRHRVSGESIKDDIFASRVPLCKVCTAPPISSVQGSVGDVAAAILQSATSAPLPDLPPSAAPAPPPAKRRKLNDDEDADEPEPLSEWIGKPVVKPDIVFFGEKLDDSFDRSLLADRDEVDLLLVLGTSLKVAPVADVTGHLPHSIPQILINRDPITHVNFDVQLLGDCDAIVRWLCAHLANVEPHASPPWTVDTADDGPEGSIAPDAQPYERLHDSHVYFFDGANRTHRWLRQFEPTPDGDEGESSVLPDPNGSIAVPPIIPIAGQPSTDAQPAAEPAVQSDV